MEEEITPEKLIEMGKKFQKMVLSSLSEDEILFLYGKEKFVKNLTLEERLVGLTVEERLTGLSAEEKRKLLVTGLSIEKRLKGLKPEERLAGLSVEEIEAYLKELEKSSPKN
ncbi:MAG: hypothetical protein GY754_12290 [bacterium]|nr:hypothetical protein [bacterium]